MDESRKSRSSSAELVCPTCGLTHSGDERFCRDCGMPLIQSGDPEPTTPERERARKIDPRYAPLRTDVKATIRRKSLAGEEYLELTPGSPEAAPVPDGGRVANANVAPSVEIDAQGRRGERAEVSAKWEVSG